MWFLLEFLHLRAAFWTEDTGQSWVNGYSGLRLTPTAHSVGAVCATEFQNVLVGRDPREELHWGSHRWPQTAVGSPGKPTRSVCSSPAPALAESVGLGHVCFSNTPGGIWVGIRGVHPEAGPTATTSRQEP